MIPSNNKGKLSQNNQYIERAPLNTLNAKFFDYFLFQIIFANLEFSVLQITSDKSSLMVSSF